jgi:hypothetical protein
VRNTLLGVLGLVVIVIVIVVATSGGGGGSTTPSGTSTTSQARGTAPARHAPPVTGVGASFAARAGIGAYRVRLDLIVDPAQAADRSATPRHGRRFVGVVFTMKVLRGSLRNAHARRDAVVVGSNGKTYTAVASPIAGYAGFRHGRVTVARGGSATGAVTFELPAGVTVSTVKWSAAPGSTLRWPVQ